MNILLNQSIIILINNVNKVIIEIKMINKLLKKFV